MKPSHGSWLMVAAISAAAGLAWYTAQGDRAVAPPPDPLAAAATPGSDTSIIGMRRPEFSLPDVAGQVHSINEWDGRVIAVNFWATWCLPCLKEVPELVALQEQYGSRGLQVIGIALQKPEELGEFMREHGMNYPVLAGEADVIAVAESYGNSYGVLPYTTVINRSGIIEFTRAGPVTGAEIEAVIAEML